MSFPANLGCLQGTGWNISEFAFEVPAVSVALAHPETPISHILRPQDFPSAFPSPRMRNAAQYLLRRPQWVLATL